MELYIQRLKQKRNNKKGAYSIIIVPLILIMVLAFAGYTDIMNQTYVVNETQQVMDTAALNALNSTVDIEQLRNEVLAMDENNAVTGVNQADLRAYERAIEEAYSYELFNMIGTSEAIPNIRIENIVVDFNLDRWGTGAQRENKPQITLDAVVVLEVKANSEFDVYDPNSATSYFNGGRNNNFVVQKRGHSGDGRVELALHNTTRLLYN